MSFIEIKLKKLKNIHKYFVFHISNKNSKKLQMMLHYFLNIIFNFLIINFNCIIIIIIIIHNSSTYILIVGYFDMYSYIFVFYAT